MAIKLPDPGNGIPEQKTGNDEWTNMKIVRDNFADQSNAASRLVGTESEQIPLSKDVRKVFSEMPPTAGIAVEDSDIDEPEFGMRAWDLNRANRTKPIPNWGSYAFIQTLKTASVAGFEAQIALPYGSTAGKMHGLAVRSRASGTWNPWYVMWHSGNASKDSNGFLKGSSPIVDLYDDHVELNNDAEAQGVELVKNGTGDYTLKTKTGLRSDNTWQIEIPQDDNKNPLFAVDIDAQDDGTINIKCYKRIFSMETFLFSPDFNEPVDINEGRFISVRLNDNPETEQLDEPAI